MKKTSRRILSFILTLSLVSGTFLFCLPAASALCELKLEDAESLTGNQAEDIVKAAEANLSKTGKELGATNHWCTAFIGQCARKANISTDIIPDCEHVETFKNLLLECGAKKVKTPQTGDIVFYGTSHAAIMADKKYAYNGNFNGKGGGEAFWKSSKVVYCKYDHASNYKKYGAFFIRPNYKKDYNLTISFNTGGGSVKSSKYKVTDGIICNKKGKTVEYLWSSFEGNPGDLFDISTFGLYKDGYSFAGWSNGTSTFTKENDAGVTARLINPDIKKKPSQSVLTAVWEPNRLTVHYNANGGVTNSKTYTTNSKGDIIKAKSKKAVCDEWIYDKTKSSGLYNAATFSLKKDGFVFSGWKTSNGKIINQDDSSVRPSDFCGDIKKSDAEITVYAYWKTACNHIPVADAATEPTCTSPGKTSGTHCSVCKEVLTAQEVIPALGHSAQENNSVIIKPDCTKDGYTQNVCSRCNCKFKSDTKPATGHTYIEKTEKKATDKASGSLLRICKDCGKTGKSEKIPAVKNIVLSASSYIYNGKSHKPSVKVSDSKGNVLVKDKDFTIKYPDSSTLPGKYKVKVTLKGKYSGSVNLKYEITPRAVKGVKLTSVKKRTANISYTAVTGATGYEVFRSDSKNGSYKRVATSSKTSYSGSKLKSRRTYYFKVRAYNYSSGERIYGSFSKAHKVKVK